MVTFFQVLKKSLVFKGRAGRKEYWLFTLVNTLIYLAILCIENFVTGKWTTETIFASVYMGLTALPSIAVGVRRLHDTGKNGWWTLLNIVPIGAIIYIIFMASEGHQGGNQYGPDPRSNQDLAAAVTGTS